MDSEDDDELDENLKDKRKKRFSQKKRFKEEKVDGLEDGRKRPRRNFRWSDYEIDEDAFYED
jgi:hypothetical protein